MAPNVVNSYTKPQFNTDRFQGFSSPLILCPFNNIIPIIPYGFLAAPILSPFPNSTREMVPKQKRWFLFSTAALHIRQSKSTASPLLTNLSFVDNLFFISYQNIKAHLGIAWENHITFHQLTLGLWVLIWSQALATENTHVLEETHQVLSSSPISIKGNWLSIVTRLSDLAYPQFQWPSCITLANLELAKLPESYTTLRPNFWIKDPLGCQLSYHSKTSFPLPTKHLRCGLNSPWA